MIALSEADWERLNGYHDGELPPGECVALERRLAAEPDLAAALRALQSQSGSLSAMRPPALTAREPATAMDADAAARRVTARHAAARDTAASEGTAKGATAREVTAQARSRRMPWLAAGALAASLALGAVLIMPAHRDASPSAVHRAFAARTFAVDQGALRSVDLRRIDGFPDLSPAGLTLVAERAVRGGEAAHYAGRNGCRATLFVGSGPFAPPEDPGIAYAAWTTGAGSVALFSEGMDGDRFAAIADYVRRALRDDGGDAVVALREATRRSKRCV